MMLTETEAATRRCPLSFGPPLSQNGMTQIGAPVPFNHGLGAVYTATQTAPSHCIASACMGWRIGVKARPAVRGPVVGVELNGDGEPRPGGKVYYANDQAPAEPERGFCGQFGVPR